MYMYIAQRKEYTSIINVTTFVALHVLHYKVSRIYKTLTPLWISTVLQWKSMSENQMQKLLLVLQPFFLNLMIHSRTSPGDPHGDHLNLLIRIPNMHSAW